MAEGAGRNRVVVVTGGGRGICEHVALRFARDGARVVVVDLVGERAARVAKAVTDRGESAIAVTCDVGSPAAVESMVSEVIERFGTIDVLVNGAGGYRAKQMAHETSEDTWDLVLDSNLKGTFLCCRAVLPHMMARRCGWIVNFSSNGARSWASGQGPEYTAAKAGVLGLTRHLAMQYAPYNILINTLAPGPTRGERVLEGKDEVQLRDRIAGIPLGRLAEPQEHAEVVFFLASVTFMTGATIDNNGGIIMV
jgi:NAD(P)-dependent dehydrogenase (short-subunit alcohol dehydrogenase family)